MRRVNCPREATAKITTTWGHCDPYILSQKAHISICVSFTEGKTARRNSDCAEIHLRFTGGLPTEYIWPVSRQYPVRNSAWASDILITFNTSQPPSSKTAARMLPYLMQQSGASRNWLHDMYTRETTRNPNTGRNAISRAVRAIAQQYSSRHLRAILHGR
jgi:hypothetical protein